MKGFLVLIVALFGSLQAWEESRLYLKAGSELGLGFRAREKKHGFDLSANATCFFY